MININFCLCQKLAKYHNNNPAPPSVWPITLNILLYINITPNQHIIYNLAILTFFFLIFSRKYVWEGSNTQHTPFRICNITLFIVPQWFTTNTSTINQPKGSILLLFIFEEYKNKLKGEAMGHVFSGRTNTYPIKVTARFTIYLCESNTTPQNPLDPVPHGPTWNLIYITEITFSWALPPYKSEMRWVTPGLFYPLHNVLWIWHVLDFRRCKVW